MTYQPRHKFGNVRTEVDNRKFQSKLEAAYYKHLKLLQAAGEVAFFLQQVPFHLKSGVKYVSDFIVFYSSGMVDVVDTKGVMTDVFLLKKRLVEDEFPVTIRIVKKGDF